MNGSVSLTKSPSKYLRNGRWVRPTAASSSAMPRSARISRLRGLSVLPREPSAWAAARSRTRTATPCRASPQASVSPVGPAPTITTFAPVAVFVTFVMFVM